MDWISEEKTPGERSAQHLLSRSFGTSLVFTMAMEDVPKWTTWRLDELTGGIWMVELRAFKQLVRGLALSLLCSVWVHYCLKLFLREDGKV